MLSENLGNALVALMGFVMAIVMLVAFLSGMGLWTLSLSAVFGFYCADSFSRWRSIDSLVYFLAVRVLLVSVIVFSLALRIDSLVLRLSVMAGVATLAPTWVLLEWRVRHPRSESS